MVNIEAVKNKNKNGVHICTTYSTRILVRTDTNVRTLLITYSAERKKKVKVPKIL